ncbi:hypothetical protein [Microlunatus sp. Y2014]|uniref:hypothetical protein n=1 Tax=Microlunatus sp. Y2014 TaxID=3418488 RepID=UPI003DA7088A
MWMTMRNLVDGKVRVAEVDVNSGDVKWFSDVLLSSNQLPAGGGLTMAADASGVYIGPLGVGNIYRIDPDTKTLSTVASGVAHANAQFYELNVADGYLYTGAFPDGEVLRIRPGDGAVLNYGFVGRTVGADTYVGAITRTATKVYGIGKGNSKLLEWPAGGGTPRDLSAYAGASGAVDMVAAGGLLYVATTGGVVSFDPADGSNRVARTLPDPADRYIDWLCVGSGGTVYAMARESGNVYRVDATTMTWLGCPLPGNGATQLLQEMSSGVLVGADSSGRLFRWALGSDPVVHDVSGTPGLAMAERVQTLLAHSNGSVWVSGSGSFTVHDVDTGTKRRVANFGEIKAMAEGPDGSVYVGMYPGCRIARVHPATLAMTVLVDHIPGQYRPQSIIVDASRNQLIIGTSPELGRYQGSVSLLDLATNTLDIRTNWLPHQATSSMFLVRDFELHLTGDTNGEAVYDNPDQKVAQFVTVDLRTNTVTRRREPRSDVRSWVRCYWRNRKTYLLSRSPGGRLYHYDLATKEAVLVADFGATGDLGGWGPTRMVYWGRGTGDIRTITSTHVVMPLYSDVPDGYYSEPRMSMVPTEQGMYGAHGTSLAFFPFF